MTRSFFFRVSLLAFLVGSGARAQLPYAPKCLAPATSLMNDGLDPQCNPLPILVPLKPKPTLGSGAKPKAWSKCSERAKNIILDAADDAQDLVTGAIEALDQLNTSTKAYDTYTKWFGVFSQLRFDIVRKVFGLLTTNNFTSYIYVCEDCSFCGAADDSACVRNDMFGVMHLCQFLYQNEVWEGFSSMPGSIIHEATHFTENGGTQDIEGAYGPIKCEQLAKEQPDLTVQNADSYEFFAEDYYLRGVGY